MEGSPRLSTLRPTITHTRLSNVSGAHARQLLSGCLGLGSRLGSIFPDAPETNLSSNKRVRACQYSGKSHLMIPSSLVERFGGGPPSWIHLGKVREGGIPEPVISQPVTGIS